MKAKKTLRNKISNIFAALILIAFCIIIDIESVGGSLWPSIISKILIFTIAAWSLNIVCGCLGEFVLGHGGFLLIGYTVAVIVAKYYGKIIESDVYRENIYYVKEGIRPLGYLLLTSDVIIAALITGIFGLIVGLISLGRLKGDYLAIVTLGISLIFVNFARNINELGGAQGFGVSTKLEGTPLIYGILVIIVIFLILRFMKSRFGRGILAIRDDAIAAEASGIPVGKYKVMAFTFSAIIAGMAGAMYAHYNSFKPVDFGQDLSIELLIIIVLGGLGSLTGSAISAILIVVYNLWFCTLSWVPDFFKSNPKIIYGVILVVIMLFRSSGIMGVKEFSWDWFYKKIKWIFNKIKRLFKKVFNKKPKEVVNNGE